MRTARILVPLLLGSAFTVVVAGPAAAGTNHSISGTVFTDVDGDNVLDPGDTGIQNCTVTLDAAPFGSPNGSTQTAADGTYSFQSVDALVEVRVDATCPGALSRSLDGPVTVPAGTVTNITGVNFGFFDPGQLFGNTFNDTDGDGVLDAGETFINGCTVTLDGGADGTVDGQTQTVDGFFFSNLRPATFRLRATCPGLAQTTADPADIVVVSGTDQGGILFGFRAQAASTTSTTAPPATTTTGQVLARTGPGDTNGGLGATGVALIGGGAAFVVLAARRRRAG